MENVNEKLTAFLVGNPGVNKAAISELTGMKGIVLFNFLKKMEKEGFISSNTEGDEVTYSLPETSNGEDLNDNVAITNEDAQIESVTEEVVKPNEEINNQDNVETPNKKTIGRDNSKFKFNKEEYGKGGLVRAVVMKYVEDNPGTTYKKLKEVFPDELLKRFGIFEEVEKAREISGKYDRYCFKEEFVIKLADKKKVVVGTQFTSENIRPFLKVAKELGYKIN
jgi:hypothetical protein